MSNNPLEFETLDIRRAPGFARDGPLLDTISQDVTIVHGPNGAGKTTLAKGLHWALWPETAPPEARLTAHFHANSDDWRVDIDGTRASFQRNGGPANQPSLPANEYRSRYQLALHELLQSDTDNESFADRIRRESAGGYDLDAAGEALGFNDTPSTRRKGEVRAASEALEAAREAKSEVEEIREDQQRLDELRRRREQAREDHAHLDLVERAIEFTQTRNEIREYCAELRSYPSVLEQVDGDEIETVERLDNEIETWKGRKEDAEGKKEEATGSLDDADLPESGLPDGLLEQAKTLQQTIGSLEEDIRRQKSELEGVKERRKQERTEIPLDLEHEDLADLNPEVWPDVEDFVTTAAEVRAERQLKRAIEERLGDPQRPDADPDTLDRGQQALEQWLETPEAGAKESDNRLQTVRRVALVSSVLLVIAGIALGALVSPLGYGLAIVGGILAVYAFVQSGSDRSEDGQRATHRQTYEDLVLDPPASWEPSAVREQLRSLYSDEASHILADQQEQQAATLSPDSDLEQKEAILEERRTKLRESLGAAPEGPDVELMPTVKGIVRWQRAHAEVKKYEGRVKQLESESTTKRQELTELLSPYFDDIQVTSAETAEGHVSALEDRQEQYESTQEQLESARGDIQVAKEELNERIERRDGVYEKLGVDPGNDDRLRDLCKQVDEYEDIKADIDGAQTRARMQSREMAEYEGYDPSLKTEKLGTLKQRTRRLRETAEDPEELSDQISRIEERVQGAKERTNVEEALRERDAALEDLEDLYESDAASMVGHTLLEHVREVTREASRPPVFERARELLAEITQGRYRLDIAEDSGRFRAYDSVDERGYALDELSSGTQLQVLLAVRLAFVDQQEQGVALPLLMDETLANSDDRRAEVIIDAVIELARAGRQVFYFTAQGDEVAKWREALEAAKEVEYETVDLAEQRDLEQSVDVPSLEAYQRGPEGPPAPEGRDHGTYGTRLDVPQFNPRKGAGGAHLWYVVDDVELLYELMELGVERWGQLRTLATETTLEAVAAQDALNDALALGRALETFVEAWQVGRGAYVDRQVIEATDAVTENFVDEVADLAKELNGDGKELVEALRAGEVSRFRRNKADELETYLTESGHIDPVNPLEPAEVRVRVVNRLVAEGVSESAAKQRATQLMSRLDEGVETMVDSPEAQT